MEGTTSDRNVVSVAVEGAVEKRTPEHAANGYGNHANFAGNAAGTDRDHVDDLS